MRANKEAREAAERDGIEIRYYNIIYNLVDDVKKAMSGLLAPTLRETMLGNAQILEIFKVSKVGKVAGCRVTDGKVERGANVRLIRDNVVDPRGQAVDSSSASRTTRAKSTPARNAAWPSRTTRTCGRRRHRVLPGRDDAALAVSPNLRLAQDARSRTTVMAGAWPGIQSTSTRASTWMLRLIGSGMTAEHIDMRHEKPSSRQHAQAARSASCASANWSAMRSPRC